MEISNDRTITHKRNNNINKKSTETYNSGFHIRERFAILPCTAIFVLTISIIQLQWISNFIPNSTTTTNDKTLSKNHFFKRSLILNIRGKIWNIQKKKKTGKNCSWSGCIIYLGAPVTISNKNTMFKRICQNMH